MNNISGEPTQEQLTHFELTRHLASLKELPLKGDHTVSPPAEGKGYSVTREGNLPDVIAAYDVLASRPVVDGSVIAVVASSYDGYLAAILGSLRSVRWLALRVSALYRNESLTTPKWELDKKDLGAYRRSRIGFGGNRALNACAAFQGNVLIAESEHDEIVPPRRASSPRPTEQAFSSAAGPSRYGRASAHRRPDHVADQWFRMLALSARPACARTNRHAAHDPTWCA